MVALNLTIVVQLLLFLAFLWGTNRLIIRPILRVMDERDEKLEQDAESALRDIADAESMSVRYAREISSARRAATSQIDLARHDATARRLTAVKERAGEADLEVAAAQREAMAKVLAQEDECTRLAPEIRNALAERLGLGGASR